MYIQGFPRRLSRKDSDCLTGDVSSIPGSGRTPGVENGNPFQYSCLGNLGRGAWQAIIHGVTKSQTWLSTLGQWSFSSYLVLTCSLCSKRWVEECAKINQRSKLLNIYINACIFKDWGKMFENYLYIWQRTCSQSIWTVLIDIKTTNNLIKNEKIFQGMFNRRIPTCCFS